MTVASLYQLPRAPAASAPVTRAPEWSFQDPCHLQDNHQGLVAQENSATPDLLSGSVASYRQIHSAHFPVQAYHPRPVHHESQKMHHPPATVAFRL